MCQWYGERERERGGGQRSRDRLLFLNDKLARFVLMYMFFVQVEMLQFNFNTLYLQV